MQPPTPTPTLAEITRLETPGFFEFVMPWAKQERLERLSQLYRYHAADLHQRRRFGEAIEFYYKALNLLDDHEIGQALVQIKTCAKAAGDDAVLEDANGRLLTLFRDRYQYRKCGDLLRETAETLLAAAAASAAATTLLEAKAFYALDDSSTHAVRALNGQLAETYIILEDYARAAAVYHEMTASTSAFTLQNVQPTFRYMLCMLAQDDVVSVRRCLDALDNLHERDYRFVSELLDARNDNNVEAFSECCARHEAVKPLGAREVDVLLAVKRLLNSEIDLS